MNSTYSIPVLEWPQNRAHIEMGNCKLNVKTTNREGRTADVTHLIWSITSTRSNYHFHYRDRYIMPEWVEKSTQGCAKDWIRLKKPHHLRLNFYYIRTLILYRVDLRALASCCVVQHHASHRIIKLIIPWEWRMSIPLPPLVKWTKSQWFESQNRQSIWWLKGIHRL